MHGVRSRERALLTRHQQAGTQWGRVLKQFCLPVRSKEGVLLMRREGYRLAWVINNRTDSPGHTPDLTSNKGFCLKFPLFVLLKRIWETLLTFLTLPSQKDFLVSIINWLLIYSGLLQIHVEFRDNETHVETHLTGPFWCFVCSAK